MSRNYNSPQKRCQKYVSELKTKKVSHYDIGTGVVSQTDMTPNQAAFRSGYMEHAKDTAAAFKFHNPDYKRKTK